MPCLLPGSCSSFKETAYVAVASVLRGLQERCSVGCLDLAKSLSVCYRMERLP